MLAPIIKTEPSLYYAHQLTVAIGAHLFNVLAIVIVSGCVNVEIQLYFERNILVRLN